jgi:hypothetical protein
MEQVLLNRRMWTRRSTWVAAALWAVILGIVGNTTETSGFALFVALFAFATMGALVAARLPQNAIACPGPLDRETRLPDNPLGIASLKRVLRPAEPTP